MDIKKAKELLNKFDNEWQTSHVYSHCIRVMNHVSKVCEELGICGRHKHDIKIAAKYHDIGKLAYTSEMLESKRKFTQEENRLAKEHSKYGYEILKIIYPNDSIAKLVLYHHEKIDGSGYPEGLKHDKIPLGSRIITVCDSYDAMFRHYNQKTKEEAIQDLKDHKGTHFDKKVVDAFLKRI